MKKAKRTFIAVMGAWMGLAGVEHGIGEILQGGIAPDGIMIYSWPNSAFFQSLNGEPALTILPDMQLTGMLAVTFSLAFAISSIFLISKRPTVYVLLPLSILMLLFGAGIFPPVLGLCIAIAAALFHTRAVNKPVSGIVRVVGKGWSWIFSACCAAWLLLFPGVAVYSYFIGELRAEIILMVMLSAFGLLFLSGWSSTLHDRLPISRV